MTAETLLPYALAVIGSLIALLCSVLAWVGVQIKGEIKALAREVSGTNVTLGNIERDLRGELSRLDRRVTRVEAQCKLKHGDED